MHVIFAFAYNRKLLSNSFICRSCNLFSKCNSYFCFFCCSKV